MIQFDDNTPFAVILAFFDGKPKARLVDPSHRGIAAIALRECRIPGDRRNTYRLAIHDCTRRAIYHDSVDERPTAELYRDLASALRLAECRNTETHEYLGLIRD